MEENISLESKILEIPELPPEIQDALENRELAVFLGAGVSRVMGLPGWEKLSNILIDECLKSKIIDDNTSKSIKENEEDPKKIISFCEIAYKEKMRGR